MLTFILISYSIMAIVTGIMTFGSICSDCADVDLWIAIILSLLTGAILPIIVALLLIISLLPIIIPCATLIYLFG